MLKLYYIKFFYNFNFFNKTNNQNYLKNQRQSNIW
jgi:hypothetical protein